MSIEIINVSGVLPVSYNPANWFIDVDDTIKDQSMSDFKVMEGYLKGLKITFKYPETIMALKRSLDLYDLTSRNFRREDTFLYRIVWFDIQGKGKDIEAWKKHHYVNGKFVT